MKIAITGAGGFVGKGLTRFFSAEHHVLALTRRSVDITDGHAVRRMITDVRPDLIINCAVLGVDDCEANPSMAHAVNVAGPQYLAEAAADHRYETYHIVNDGACSYYEFALEVARELGMWSAEIDSLIEAVTESEMQRTVSRPRYTPMRCLASEELGLPALRCWRKALSQYLNGLRS
jgi:dTDP-4-dehydrorhamnose reductase